ncbi:MAG: glycosyltransferase family 39 protein, partial [Candidatus Woesearchaeota archaeon]
MRIILNIKNALKKKSTYILLLILIFAFFLRFNGIDYGLPNLYWGDEATIVYRALKMGTGDLNPHWFVWPATPQINFMFIVYGFLFSFGYVFGIYQSPTDFIYKFLEDPTVWYLIARFIIVLVGVATIYLVYVLGKKIYNKNIGLMAALFLSVSFIHAKLSHMIKPDIPVTLFILLSVYFCYRLYETGKLRHYLLSGLFAGVAISFLYSGIFLVISIFVAHLLYCMKNKKSVFELFKNMKSIFEVFLNKKLIFAYIYLILVFILLVPWAIFSFGEFMNDFVFITTSVVESNALNAYLWHPENGWVHIITLIFNDGLGIILSSVAFVGVLFALYKRSSKEILLLSFPVTMFVVFGFLSELSSRNIIPILPFLTIFAALLIYNILKPLLNKKILVMSLIFVSLLLIIVPAHSVIKFNHILTQKDTRTLSKEWIESNIPFNSKIMCEGYPNLCPPLIRNKESSLNEGFPQMEVNLDNKGINAYTKLLNAREYPENTYYVTLVWKNGKDPLVRLKEENIEYVAISSLRYQSIFSDIALERDPELALSAREFYNHLDNKNQLLRTFSPNNFDTYGPEIKV